MGPFLRTMQTCFVTLRLYAEGRRRVYRTQRMFEDTRAERLPTPPNNMSDCGVVASGCAVVIKRDAVSSIRRYVRRNERKVRSRVGNPASRS